MRVSNGASTLVIFLRLIALPDAVNSPVSVPPDSALVANESAIGLLTHSPVLTILHV
jgi:hypothetical protein